MKRFRMKFLFIAVLIIAALVTPIYIAAAKTDNPVHDASVLKERLGIVIKEDKNKPAIDEKEAIELAEKYTNNLSLIAKSVHAQYTILTDEGLSINAISSISKEKNVKLKEKSFINEIPVWIVSYDGLNIARTNGIVLHEHNLVIDATTGEYLYGFRYR